MFTIIAIAVAFISSLPYAVIAAGVIGLAALWILVKWSEYMQGVRNPLDRELRQTSHGAALILLTPLLAHVAFGNHWTNLLPPDFVPWVWPCVFGLMGLGGFLLVVGAMRTRTNFRDAQLIARAVIKVAVGGVIGWTLYNNILPPQDWPYRHNLSLALFFLALWCGVTGIVKFVLLMRGPPGLPGAKNRMPHGDATHPTRGGLG